EDSAGVETELAIGFQAIDPIADEAAGIDVGARRINGGDLVARRERRKTVAAIQEIGSACHDESIDATLNQLVERVLDLCFRRCRDDYAFQPHLLCRILEILTELDGGRNGRVGNETHARGFRHEFADELQALYLDLAREEADTC